ncbi:hypothetical protein B0H14DRAFT_3448942 [Mycena olivaceomarginata]|nr:hypothetical protein B0H14DRAFT_3448942 [Mycena olivaceomarginata]
MRLIHVPNIAIVIHEQNLLLLKDGTNRYPGVVHINVEAFVSNPFTNLMSDCTWMLQSRCMGHHIYGSIECRTLHSWLPECLESTDMTFKVPTRANRATCMGTIPKIFCVRASPGPGPRNPAGFHPEFDWMEKQLREQDSPARARVVIGLDLGSVNMEVHTTSVAEGDP